MLGMKSVQQGVQWLFKLSTIKANVNKNRAASFSMKMSMTASEHRLCGSCINHMDTIKDLGVFLDS